MPQKSEGSFCYNKAGKFLFVLLIYAKRRSLYWEVPLIGFI